MVSAIAKNIVFTIAIASYLVALSLYGIMPQDNFEGYTGLDCLLMGGLGFFLHINLFLAWTANLFWGLAVGLYLWSAFRPAPTRIVSLLGAASILCGLALCSLLFLVQTVTIMRGACCSDTVQMIPGPGAQLWIGSFVTLILAFAFQYHNKSVSYAAPI